MSANSALILASLELPTGASVQQKLGQAVKCAGLALPMEEWQPWQFHAAEGHVELHAQARRNAPLDDIFERELMVCCGTALQHLKLAMKYLGCLGRVEAFPDLAQGGLVARVYHGSGHAADTLDLALFEAMTEGADKPASRNEAPMDEDALAMLEDALASEKAWLEFSRSEPSRQRLVTLAGSNPGTTPAPTPRQTQPEHSRVAQWAKPLLTFVVRGGPGKFTVETARQRAEELAALAVIKTKTDDKHGWLATGQLMARARLLARAAGISSQSFAQAFGTRRVREELRMSIGHKGYVQAIIGFGSRFAQRAARPLMSNGFETGTDHGRRAALS